jgi:hypothetical protein
MTRMPRIVQVRVLRSLEPEPDIGARPAGLQSQRDSRLASHAFWIITARELRYASSASGPPSEP